MIKMEIDEFGNKIWKNEAELLHREDGPAIEFTNGTKYWYRDGRRHREDGAAYEHTNGYREYWYCGKLYPEIENDEDWKRLVRLIVFR